MQPLVSALVLNYRSPRDCHRCVDALLKQTVADRLEILLTDNHSDDESIGWLRARWNGKPGVRIIEAPRNLGYGQGNGYAATYADGEYLLIINPDNTLPPDAVERMIAILKSEPGAGIVGPALVHDDGTIRASARKFPRLLDPIYKRLFPKSWHAKYEREMEGKRLGLHQVDWLVGACLLLRRDLFGTLGGFDPRFFMFFEDIDLCRRAWAVGKRVLYAPDIRVRDRKERLSDSGIAALFTRKIVRIHAASGIKYFWKWKTQAA